MVVVTWDSGKTSAYFHLENSAPARTIFICAAVESSNIPPWNYLDLDPINSCIQFSKTLICGDNLLMLIGQVSNFGCFKIHYKYGSKPIITI